MTHVTGHCDGGYKPGRFPGLLIRLVRSIGGAAAMARDLPAHRRGSSIQMASYLTNR